MNKDELKNLIKEMLKSGEIKIELNLCENSFAKSLNLDITIDEEYFSCGQLRWCK